MSNSKRAGVNTKKKGQAANKSGRAVADDSKKALNRAQNTSKLLEKRIKEKAQNLNLYLNHIVDLFISDKITEDTFLRQQDKALKRYQNEVKQRRGRQVKHLERMTESREGFVVIGSPKNLRLFDKRDNISNLSYKIEPYPVTESTAKFLSKEIFKLARDQIVAVKRKYPAGANVFIRAFMESEGKTASKVIKATKVKVGELEKQIYIQLMHVAHKQHPTSDYVLDLSAIDVLVTGFGAKGGCNDGKTLHRRVELRKDAIMHLTNHKSKDNNCLIQCFNYSYGVAGNKMKASTVRKDLDIAPGTKIHFRMIPKLCNYYNEKFNQNKGYVVVNEANEVLLFKHPRNKREEVDDSDVEDAEEIVNSSRTDESNELVKIYLASEHYYTYEMIIFDKCEGCGRRLSVKNEDHKCNRKMASFYSCEVSGKKDVVRSNNIEKPKVDYNDMVYWDTETFQSKDSVCHEVYASAYSIGGKYTVYYGEGSLDKTVNDMLEMQGKTILAYNTSGFDSYFLIHMLTDRNFLVEDILVNCGKVLSFNFRKNDSCEKNKVFDLYLFTQTSLSNACNDFKIKNCKSDEFDVLKVKSWDDVEKYEDECRPYLRMDVLALKELFESFNDMIWSTENVNITQFITASHMGYCIWQKGLDKVVEIPKCLDKMAFIRKSTYGGRCYPQQQLYKSALHDDVLAGTINYQKLVESKQFIFNADASSLYPASMAGFEHMDVEYPLGHSRWSEFPIREWRDGKIGFYEIKFVCPKGIRIPVLPRKKLCEGVPIGVEWSLFDGRGVYTSIDIQNAIESGYDIQFVGKCLVYDEKGKVFNKYIDHFYAMKGKAEKEGNDCLRSIAKLLLNSLYGKMLMRPITTNTVIVNSAYDLHKFMKNHEMTEYVILNDNKIMVTGEVPDDKKVDKITKPSQLGAFILGYSRRIMLFYLKQIDPSLKSAVFTYTDTDSLHISGEAYLNLFAKGLIKTKKDASLGLLCSDIKNEGLIIAEVNLAPKTYQYTYIDQNGHIDTVKKCKGIPKAALKKIDYMRHRGKEIQFSGLQRKFKLTKSDKERGVTNFSICNLTQTRTFIKNEWKGMPLIKNEFYPLGYQTNT